MSIDFSLETLRSTIEPFLERQVFFLSFSLLNVYVSQHVQHKNERVRASTFFKNDMLPCLHTSQLLYLRRISQRDVCFSHNFQLAEIS